MFVISIQSWFSSLLIMNSMVMRMLCNGKISDQNEFNDLKRNIWKWIEDYQKRIKTWELDETINSSGGGFLLKRIDVFYSSSSEGFSPLDRHQLCWILKADPLIRLQIHFHLNQQSKINELCILVTDNWMLRQDIFNSKILCKATCTL